MKGHVAIMASVVALGSIPASAPVRSLPATPHAVRLCVTGTVANTPFDWVASATRDAVRLATSQWQARFKHLGITLRSPLVLNDGDAAANGPDSTVAARVAKQCVKATDTLGFIGPQYSEVAPAVMPILNRAAMAEITVTANTASLTSPAFRASLEPLTAAHRLSTPTFFRPTASDTVTNEATMAFASRTLHAQSYFLVRDQDPDGIAFDSAVEAYGRRLGMQEVGAATIDMDPSRFSSSVSTATDTALAKHPEVIIFGATAAGASSVPLALRSKGYTRPVIEGQQLSILATSDGSSWRGFRLPSDLASIKDLYTVYDTADPSSVSQPFRREFRRQFRSAAPPLSSHAFDAANMLLSSIYTLAARRQLDGGLKAMRAAVTTRVAHTSWQGASGTVSFDANGDTRHPLVSVYRAAKGRLTYVGLSPILGSQG